MRVLVTAEYSQSGLVELREIFEEVVYEPWTSAGRGKCASELLKRLQTLDADALITELDEVSEEVIAGIPDLRFIGDCRGNPSNIDVVSAKEKGIPIFCTPARNAQAVAELLVGSIIAFYRNLVESVNYVRDGNWNAPPPKTYYEFQGNELCGKKIAFIGFGGIARIAERIAKAFGMHTMFFDPYVKNAECRAVGLEEAFCSADVVSINLAVTPETKGMIGARLLGMMKKDALFVNTSRSAVVNYYTLYQILSENKIKGAILDVFEHEPPSGIDQQLIELENVLATPHICGATFEVVEHQSDSMNEQLKKHFQWKTERN